MSDIFEPISPYDTHIKSNSIFDFDILEEMGNSEKRGVKSQFIRFYNHMLKYQFQKNLQSPSWITTIIDASNELSESSEKASLWNSITEKELQNWYNSARRITINNSNTSDQLRLEHEIPKDIPNEYAKENCINYEFIKSYCRKYVNHNLPEMERYIASMD